MSSFVTYWLLKYRPDLGTTMRDRPFWLFHAILGFFFHFFDRSSTPGCAWVRNAELTIFRWWWYLFQCNNSQNTTVLLITRKVNWSRRFTSPITPHVILLNHQRLGLESPRATTYKPPSYIYSCFFKKQCYIIIGPLLDTVMPSSPDKINVPLWEYLSSTGPFMRHDSLGQFPRFGKRLRKDCHCPC